MKKLKIEEKTKKERKLDMGKLDTAQALVEIGGMLVDLARKFSEILQSEKSNNDSSEITEKPAKTKKKEKKYE